MKKGTIVIEDISKNYQLNTSKHPSLYESIQSIFTKSKASSDFWALKDINFQLNPGEVLGIVGKNGAGKSTLLKILSKITQPTTGRVTYYGSMASLLEVGTGFHPDLSGRENIFMNGAMLGLKIPEIRAKYDEIVAFSGLEKFLETPVKRYSSGMYVRLAFAVAAHLEPDILIIDEVLSVGDIEFQRKCLGKLKSVSGEGRSVLFVSHNLATVEALCTHAIWLKEGRMEQQGSTKDIITSFLQSMDSSISSDLLLMEKRVGSGEIKASSFNLTSSEGLTIQFVETGNSFNIEIGYTIFDSLLESDQIHVGVEFTSRHQVKVFSHTTSWVGQAFSSSEVKNNKKFILHLENFALNTGIYSIGIVINKGNTVLDHVENAAEINVISGQIFNYQDLPKLRDSIFLQKGSWSVG